MVRAGAVAARAVSRGLATHLQEASEPFHTASLHECVAVTLWVGGLGAVGLPPFVSVHHVEKSKYQGQCPNPLLATTSSSHSSTAISRSREARFKEMGQRSTSEEDKGGSRTHWPIALGTGLSWLFGGNSVTRKTPQYQQSHSVLSVSVVQQLGQRDNCENLF